jgi:predicted Zn-dependent peptidase
MQGQIIPQPQSTSVPSIKIGKSTNFELKNGLKVMVVENHKLPRVSYSLSLDNMPYADDIKGVADITSQLIGMELQKTSKSEFKEVDFCANIYFSSKG